MRLIQNSYDGEYRQRLTDLVITYENEAAQVKQNILGERAILESLAGPPPEAEEAECVLLFQEELKLL